MFWNAAFFTMTYTNMNYEQEKVLVTYIKGEASFLGLALLQIKMIGIESLEKIDFFQDALLSELACS